MNKMDKSNTIDEPRGSKSHDRYQRKHLKPIAKSVYQNKKVARLNGSLNQAVGLSGLNMNESAKGLHSNSL